MKIYHGSDAVVDHPKIIGANRPLDLGNGFYLTSNWEQAKKWANQVALRNRSDIGYINVYDFDFAKARNDLIIKNYPKADGDWLAFVCANRRGELSREPYDIVIGPVADDRVYRVVVRYENGDYDLEEALKRLKTETLCDQILFHSEESLKYLKFISAEAIDENRRI